ncbi:MAG: PSD1 and planctomycete cytochrome C domain-containing protein [Pirellulaceae bacterium]
MENRTLISSTAFATLCLVVLCFLVLGFEVLGFEVLGTRVDAEEITSTSQQLAFFEKEVRPLLAEHCYACHSVNAEKIQAGLLMDSRDALLKGGDSGEAMVPGDVDGSLLIEAVRYESYEMPPKGKLADDEIESLERWVEMGAPWPVEEAPTAETQRPEFFLQERKDEHWVWQPIKTPVIPDVTETSWPRDDIDHFVLAKLESASLSPAGDSDRAALMRRLYFDLIGLPPTPDQAEAFISDTSADATERLVDQLLDSPHFGERWGRHWLDLVRYAESRGHEFDNDTPNAFQYRDYIIRALNADVPYDQLVREHIAGDLLSTPRLHPESGFNESILGTGFWFLGEWVHSPVDIRKDESDRFDNMIDVMSKTFLGVTVSCARCHDHKFDAISTADYYSMSGFLQSSDYRQVRFESLEHNRRIAKQLAQLDERYREKIASMAGNVTPEFGSRSGEVASSVVFDYATLAADEYMQDGFVFGDRPRAAGDVYLSTSVVTPSADNQTLSVAKLERRRARAKKRPTQNENDPQGKPQSQESAPPSQTAEPLLRFATVTAAVSDPFWNGLESISSTTIQNKDKLYKLPRSGRTLRTPTFTLTDGDVACRVRGAGHVVACVDSHRLIAGPLHGETIRPIQDGEAWIHLKLDRYIGHRLHLEFTPAENVSLEVSLITQGATPEVLKQLSQREATLADAVEKFAEATRKALGAEAIEIAKAWATERSELQSRVMRRSQLAMAMLDGTGEDDRVLIRGNASKPGDVEPRHFLTAVTGNQPLNIAKGSGRLELAQQINAPTNPLTSRVIVNRVWHYLIGRGIVPTTDDFGVLGQRPTHPELLDHLAGRFVQDGRSMKRLIRNIVLTRTYQMSSQGDAKAVAADPKNLLWHHRSPKRLEGEAIRDALLVLSGKLDTTQFGEAVPIHLTAFMDGRGRPNRSGPLDGAGRRSIYTSVRRNFLSPFMTTFDSPTPFSTMGRRNVSNVPAQALILMNDPLVVELANGWAKRAIENHAAVDSRIQWLYQSAFARQVTPQEQAIATAFVTTQASDRGVKDDDPQLWTDFAHALINTKEFTFLR